MSRQSEVPTGCTFLVNPVGYAPIFTTEQLTEEQRMFAQSAADFVEREVMPDVDRLEAHEPGLMAQKLRRAGQLGLLMLDIPEAYGGLELDMATSMLCAEVMANYPSWSVSWGAHTGIGTLPLLYFGTDEQRKKYLPKLATGELLAAYCLTEPSSGSDAMNARTRATLVTGPDGKEYWKLNGTKMWITNGGFADLYTVFAKVDGQAFTAFLVEAKTPGVSAGAEEHKMGIRGSSTTQVNLEDVLVPKENLLGDLGKGHKIAFNVLNVGRFKLGIGGVGAGKHMLRVAMAYAKERIAFGQPIADFGAVRQKLADMVTRVYALESMCYRVGGHMVRRIEALDRTAPDYNEKVMAAIEEYAIEDSIIKVYASESYAFVVDEALQIHGGYGFHQDYEVERAYRDQRINRIFEGTSEINRMLIPGTLMKRVMKGEIPLFAAVQAIQRELEQPRAELPAPAGDSLSWEVALVESAKRVALFTANAAVQRFMTQLKDEQEILLALADQLIHVFAADSTLTRALQYPGAGQHAVGRIVAVESYLAVLDIARRLAPALASKAGLAKHLAALDRWTVPVAVDLIAAKRKVAEIALERDGWPFALPQKSEPAPRVSRGFPAVPN